MLDELDRSMDLRSLFGESTERQLFDTLQFLAQVIMVDKPAFLQEPAAPLYYPMKHELRLWGAAIQRKAK